MDKAWMCLLVSGYSYGYANIAGTSGKGNVF